jgi:hypothetical protein
MKLQATTDNYDAFVEFQTVDNNAFIGLDDSLNLLKINNDAGIGAYNHLVIDTSGNVGIGTSGPDSKIHLYDGALHVQQTDGSDTWFSLGANNDNYITTGSSGITVFRSIGTQRMRIDSSGNLLVGKTAQGSATVGGEILANGTVIGTRSGSTAGRFNRTTSDGNIVDFRKDNTVVGSIGVNSVYAYIGTPSVNTLIKFDNTRIIPANSSGNSNDNSIDLGVSSSRFQDIFATNGTIQTSDRNEKQDIEELSDAEQRVAVVAKGLMRKFRWIDSVAEKGDNARTHFGIIAQDLQDAFTAEGLDAGDYAMFISDTWTDDDGNEQTRLGVRYNQLLAFIISAI